MPQKLLKINMVQYDKDHNSHTSGINNKYKIKPIAIINK